METNIIVETNSVLDGMQNVEIRRILQNGGHIFSVIYCTKMLIKVNQLHAVSSNMHVLENVNQSKPTSYSIF